jgi:serine/threonine protein kinase
MSHHIPCDLLFEACYIPHLETHAMLGYGSSAVVDKVRLTPGGSFYALKQHALDSSELGKVQKELRLLAKVGHRHLSRLKGIAVKDRTCSLLVSPVAETTLATILQSDDQHPKQNWFRSIGCLAGAVKAMHDAGFVHLDLNQATYW